MAEFVEQEINAHAATVILESQLDGAAFFMLGEDIKEQWTVLGDRLHVTQL